MQIRLRKRIKELPADKEYLSTLVNNIFARKPPHCDIRVKCGGFPFVRHFAERTGKIKKPKQRNTGYAIGPPKGQPNSETFKTR